MPSHDQSKLNNNDIFTHIVLTRFNLKISIKNKASDSWLTNRIKIMKNTLLPSMAKQTVKPDYWLILCDNDSPIWFKEEITKVVGKHGKPIWVKEEFAPEKNSKIISEIVKPLVKTPWLITTRIDNDDCVSKLYIESIQSEFRYREEFLNFVSGLQYEKGWIYHRRDPSNAFISLSERNENNIKTVFIDGHHLLENHGTIRQIRTKPIWMQVVHGDNLANTVHGIRTSPDVLEAFSHNLILHPFRGLRPRMLALLDVCKLAYRVISARHRRAWLLKVLFGR